MASDVVFNAEGVIKGVAKLNVSFDNFEIVLKTINDYIETVINVNDSSGVLGIYGSKLKAIWDQNASTFGDFHANFEAWSEVVSAIAASKQSFALDVTAMYRNNGGNLDGIENARSSLKGENITLGEDAKKVLENAKKDLSDESIYKKYNEKEVEKVIEEIVKDIEDNFDIDLSSLDNIEDLSKSFKNNGLNLKMGLLSRYYSASKVEEIIKSSIGDNKGSAATVAAAMALINLGIDKGITTQYTIVPLKSESKPFTTDLMVSKGSDCASFVSWALNYGTSQTFNNASIKTLANLGTKIDYSQAKVGDLIVRQNSSGRGGHAMIVLKNNPSNNEVIVADCSDQVNNYTKGVRIQRVSYKTLSGSNYRARNMDNFYD